MKSETAAGYLSRAGYRRLLVLQVVTVALVASVFFAYSHASHALAAGFGGAIAVATGALLRWRMWRTETGPALDAARSLRVLYRTALERMVLVGALFAAGVGLLQLAAGPMIVGFIGGQVALFVSGINNKS